jgi:hypothetical protein
MEARAKNFKWVIEVVDSDDTLAAATARITHQLAKIKGLFGEFLLGIKFGLGTRRSSGHMGGRLNQCAAAFLNMHGVYSLGRSGHFLARLCVQCRESMREYTCTALCVNG